MTDEPPRRVLLVSATIGEGHNATARAVEEAVRDLWPHCEVSWLDSLEVMGRWVPPAFRWIYVTNVETTPWLYNFFYDALWRYRWFADSARRFVGAWSGRRLRPLIAAGQPDLIVSTYPLGTAGLNWLRRRGELPARTAAVVSDFSPHPFWVYPEIDQHYVMSEASLRELHRAQPDAAGAVCVPPVVSAFRPLGKPDARRAFGLPEDGFQVLVSCGSFGFGSVERAVDAALRISGVGRVVVVCGRNDVLRERLAARAASDPRLVPLGWVQDMAALTASADVMVTNAGGATALEALACGRTVVMFEPIAGHGRGNAVLMAKSGLAHLCPHENDLSTVLRSLVADPQRLVSAEQRALRHAQASEFRHQVRALADLPRHRGQRALRPQDAFFVYATTPEVPQQIGAVVRLAGASTNMSTEDWFVHLTGLITSRSATLPMLRRRLVRRRGRRPVWMPCDDVNPAEHVAVRELPPGNVDQWREVWEEFFSSPVRTDRPPWELLLVRDLAAESTTLLVKMHHALGDGIAMASNLLRLLQDDFEDSPTTRTRRPTAQTTAAGQPWRQRIREIGCGLVGLAGAGTAPVTWPTGRSTVGRRFEFVELPAAAVREHARARRVGTSVLLLGVVAEALHRLLDGCGGTSPGQRFRAMVPMTTRTRDGGAGADKPGNHTVAVSVDLPVGPMPPAQRVAEVAALLADPRRGSQPAAAGAVLTALGRLPAPVHAWLVRRVYHRRFLNAIVSILPGRRRPPRVAGALMTAVFPVLPLAEGVGLAVGALNWHDSVAFGITMDTGLVPVPDKLADHLRSAFGDIRTEDMRTEGIGTGDNQASETAPETRDDR